MSPTTHILLPILLLAACAPDITPDARYIGSTTPTAPSDLCKPSRAVLRIRNGEIIFTPDETTWTLAGKADANGALQAEHIGNGANKQPYPTRLTGTWTANAATGTYTTPRCSYVVQLARR